MRTFNSNMKKAYALIHDVYCTRPLQYQIADAILVDGTITNDPIKLLATIRDLMHETIRTKYPMVSLVEIQTNMLSIAQRETETMAEYHKRFKEHKDMMFMQVSGKTYLHEWTKTLAGYSTADPEDQAQMLLDVVPQYMAYLLIKGAHKDKYGSLIDNLNSQYSLGNNQWPKTLAAAAEDLSNHN
jgi:hypothetical protein